MCDRTINNEPIVDEWFRARRRGDKMEVLTSAGLSIFTIKDWTEKTIDISSDKDQEIQKLKEVIIKLSQLLGEKK